MYELKKMNVSVYNDLISGYPMEGGGGETKNPGKKAQVKMFENKIGLTIALSPHCHKMKRLLPHE